jgi:hypothetical protein
VNIQNLQNISDTNPDWRVGARRIIPAEFQANFLKALADLLGRVDA